MGVISYHEFGWWFSRYWPALLIVAGLVRLMEYLWARNHNQPAPRFGAGGVFFLIFLIVFGMAASQASRVDWRGLGVELDSNDDFGGFFGTRYEFSDNFSQPMATGTQVRVLSARGDIVVTPSPDNAAHAFVHKFTRTHSQEEANQFNNSTHPKFEQQGNIWLLDMTNGSFHEGRVKLELQVPRTYTLSLVTNRGDIHVSEMEATVEVQTDHGDVNAEGIKGNTVLRLHRGDATIKNIHGDLNVDGDMGDINVSDVSGTVTLNGSYRDVSLAHLSGPVRFNTSRTDLQFAKLDGELTIDRGNLHATSLAGPLRLNTNAKDIHVESVTGEIYIEDRRGDIELEAKPPLGKVEISTTGGEIKVTLPEKPGFQVDAESDGGQIQSDFSLNINNDKSNATATGTVGKGGPLVKLKTDRGTIQINKG
jgi:DUF4097 and DUF4098 domain-containing protein YvlB